MARLTAAASSSADSRQNGTLKEQLAAAEARNAQQVADLAAEHERADKAIALASEEAVVATAGRIGRRRRSISQAGRYRRVL
jgi:hypothetical protein